MSLLGLIQGIARTASSARFLVWGLAVCAVGGFSYIILAGDPRLDTYLLPCMVALGWAICLLGIAANFCEVPQKPEPGYGFVRRLKMQITYVIAWFWALVFLLCSCILLYLTLRSISLVFMG